MSKEQPPVTVNDIPSFITEKQRIAYPIRGAIGTSLTGIGFGIQSTELPNPTLEAAKKIVGSLLISSGIILTVYSAKRAIQAEQALREIHDKVKDNENE